MSVGKTLVLGASGNIGAPLFEALLRAGYPVRAASRRKLATVVPHAEWMPFDYAETSTHARALAGIERLFLLTPVVPNTVELTASLVRVAKAAGVKRIVKLSAMGAPPMTFARWHREAEEEIVRSGIPYTFLRPTGFMQNYVNIYGASIKAQSAFYAPTAEAKVSHIDVRDIADVALETLVKDGHEGKVYDLTGPEALTNSEIAALLSRVAGRKISYVALSEGDAEKGMKQAGMPEWMVKALLELHRSYREGEASVPTGEVTRITGHPARTFLHFAEENRPAFG